MSDLSKKVVVAGGSGAIGSALTKKLNQEGYEVSVLSRTPKRIEGATVVQWDGKTTGEWVTVLEGAKAIINLSGSSIAKKWTPDEKERILSSRVVPTRAIHDAIQSCNQPPDVWINASAIGIYEETGDLLADETTKPGSGFLGATCSQWEQACLQQSLPKTQRIILRIGVVLGKEMPAFEVFKKLTSAFLGGHVGNGQQWVSWIHSDDLINLFLWCIQQNGSQIYNAVAPRPERNRDLMRCFRKTMHRPWSPPAPSFMLGVANLFGGPDPSLATMSTRVSSQKLLNAGFRFQYPDLHAALKNLFSQ